MILHLHLLCDKLFTSFIDIEPPMLKCCGCQTNFILPLGGSFLFSKNFLSTPSLTGGLVMPIRRTITKKSPHTGRFLGIMKFCS